jgi:NAD(P)-dependent dehydrogenase (short-subunit alcohol dehydrogenase family)
MANAKIASYGSVPPVDPETSKRVLDINILGVFHTVRAALPALIGSNGYVLVMSSMAAFGSMPGCRRTTRARRASSTAPTHRA